jgi:hypothetical protein
MWKFWVWDLFFFKNGQLLKKTLLLGFFFCWVPSLGAFTYLTMILPYELINGLIFLKIYYTQKKNTRKKKKKKKLRLNFGPNHLPTHLQNPHQPRKILIFN